MARGPKDRREEARRRRARRERGGLRAAPGGRLVHLTPARRSEAVGRQSARMRGRVVTLGGPRAATAAADFHLATAVTAARAAGRIILDYWGRRGSLPVHEKGRNDFVTVVDREAEAAILKLVRRRFPDHTIFAEESAPVRGAGAYRWHIDPLDGTTNFIHGYPFFGVSIGVADAQGMRAAVVFDPVRDEMFTAARGRGAALNGAPIRVSAAQRLSQALLVTGIPFRSHDRLDPYLATFRAFALASTGIRRDGSAALDLAYVACGRYEGFWEMALSSWDVAAGSLLVTEAGGVVTDFGGRGDYIDAGDIIASTPALHPSMLRIVRDGYRAP